MEMHLVVGEPIVNILNNNFFNSDEIVITGDQKYNLKNVWKLNPEFIEGSYELPEKSALINKGTDKLNLGLILKTQQ
jgi:poly(beta-D-mannuronate) lyase